MTHHDRQIETITLDNGTLRARILTIGAAIQSLSWCDSAHSMVLGYPTVEPYFTNPGKLGVIVGRYANRIRGARAEIDGAEYHFDANLGGIHCLHGGRDTLGLRVMTLVEATPVSVHLRDVLPDGHMGFPGNLTVDVIYALDGATLRTTILGKTDATTLCNFTGHSYFNLSGNHDISDHRLQVAAEQRLEVDAESIPTGQYLDVAGTEYDLRDQASLAWGEGMRTIDMNYCLSDNPTDLRAVAVLRAGGNTMTLATTEAGLQVYTAHNLGTPLPSAPHGRAFHPYAGVALEPQYYPNSPNIPQFASAILHPDDDYRHVTEYRFSRD